VLSTTRLWKLARYAYDFRRTRGSVVKPSQFEASDIMAVNDEVGTLQLYSDDEDDLGELRNFSTAARQMRRRFLLGL
jgi:hypothetical protein